MKCSGFPLVRHSLLPVWFTETFIYPIAQFVLGTNLPEHLLINYMRNRRWDVCVVSRGRWSLIRKEQKSTRLTAHTQAESQSQSPSQSAPYFTTQGSDQGVRHFLSNPSTTLEHSLSKKHPTMHRGSINAHCAPLMEIWTLFFRKRLSWEKMVNDPESGIKKFH